MENIASIATPLGSGGISIIRLSGDSVLDIALKFFTAKNLNKDNIKARYMYLGTFVGNDIIDKCLMVYFKAPFSFTGEDIIEFHIHGGELLASKILDCLLIKARLAENGEFSKRAFCNGKMSLNDAENMIDMINATSKSELLASNHLKSNKLCTEIKQMQERIKDVIVNLCVAIDYPEYETDFEENFNAKKMLENLKSELCKLKSSFSFGQVIKSGVYVAIVGRPNVGKSSLLNALLNKERAIVTDVKGTTRDVLEESINYKGIKINFVDTAGIRQSSDVVESIGIQKSKESLDYCNIVLCVLDASEKMQEEDKEILQLVNGKNVIYVFNKCDKDIFNESVKEINGIQICASNNTNVDKIKEEILQKVKLDKIDFSELILTNKRHFEVVCEALNKINEILCDIDLLSTDLIESQLKRLYKILGKITGESENESIITDIFSKFCLGK